MAVDVMHLSPTKAFTKLAFQGKSKSSEELSHESTYPYPASPTSSKSSSSGSSSLMDVSLTAHEQSAVEQLGSTRQQLQDEVEYLVGELTRIGQEMSCTAECIQIIQDSDEDEVKKLTRKGRKLFNSKPKEGVRFLIEKGLLNSTPEDVALFLFVNQPDKHAIGEYLGEGKEFNIRVLHEFVKLQKFHGLDLVQALRTFLSCFQLPGEAQKIDRMMESFAQRYCECNPGTFSNTDACYILSFSIIMLNTSLHNPNVKNKPSVEQFIGMNRDIDSGKDLPSEMLRGQYDAIKQAPFQWHTDTDDISEVFFNPEQKGWLVKEGGKHKTWRKRWFILTDNCLYYFKTPNDTEPRGIIPLENLEVRECPEVKKPHCFEICLNERLNRSTIKACKTKTDGKVHVGNHMNYRIQASSPGEKEEWVKRIQASISRNPFLEMLQERRQRQSKKGPVGL